MHQTLFVFYVNACFHCPAQLERGCYSHRSTIWTRQTAVTSVFPSPNPGIYLPSFLWRIGFIILTFQLFVLVDVHRTLHLTITCLGARAHFSRTKHVDIVWDKVVSGEMIKMARLKPFTQTLVLCSILSPPIPSLLRYAPCLDLVHCKRRLSCSCTTAEHLAISSSLSGLRREMNATLEVHFLFLRFLPHLSCSIPHNIYRNIQGFTPMGNPMV